MGTQFKPITDYPKAQWADLEAIAEHSHIGMPSGHTHPRGRWGHTHTDTWIDRPQIWADQYAKGDRLWPVDAGAYVSPWDVAKELEIPVNNILDSPTTKSAIGFDVWYINDEGNPRLTRADADKIRAYYADIHSPSEPPAPVPEKPTLDNVPDTHFAVKDAADGRIRHVPKEPAHGLRAGTEHRPRETAEQVFDPPAAEVERQVLYEAGDYRAVHAKDGHFILEANIKGSGYEPKWIRRADYGTIAWARRLACWNAFYMAIGHPTVSLVRDLPEEEFPPMYAVHLAEIEAEKQFRDQTGWALIYPDGMTITPTSRQEAVRAMRAGGGCIAVRWDGRFIANGNWYEAGDADMVVDEAQEKALRQFLETL